MHYRQIVILVVTCLVAFGVYSLPEMHEFLAETAEAMVQIAFIQIMLNKFIE